MNRIDIDRTTVQNILKQRPEAMHKGQAGRVLIIAGQTGMAGAAVLTARGALYSGAGLVKICAPREIFDILQVSVTEAMCVDRADYAKSSQSALRPLLEVYDAIAIGPGLGVSKENVRLLRNVLQNFAGPVVIDADGLNCLCEEIDVIGRRQGVTVITPHPGEADRILKAMGKPGYKEMSREAVAQELTQNFAFGGKLVALLKGSGTLIAESGDAEAVYVNPTGNPGMATGGSGDVLTGVIVSLLAQKYLEATPLEAVQAAAYIHGLAGDIAAENIGQYGMTSVDIADAISAAIKEVTGF